MSKCVQIRRFPTHLLPPIILQLTDLESWDKEQHVFGRDGVLVGRLLNILSLHFPLTLPPPSAPAWSLFGRTFPNFGVCSPGLGLGLPTPDNHLFLLSFFPSFFPISITSKVQGGRSYLKKVKWGHTQTRRSRMTREPREGIPPLPAITVGGSDFLFFFPFRDSPPLHTQPPSLPPHLHTSHSPPFPSPNPPLILLPLPLFLPFFLFFSFLISPFTGAGQRSSVTEPLPAANAGRPGGNASTPHEDGEAPSPKL